MTFIEANPSRNTFLTPLESISNSQRATIITCIALTTLAICMLSFSAWANIKVATVYGSGSIMQHSAYTIFLPSAITLLIVSVLAYLATRHHRMVNNSEIPINVPAIVVSSIMPGKCILKCELGASVKEGDALYELECMKMFTTFLAEKSGCITEIFVTSGQTIDVHQPILHIK